MLDRRLGMVNWTIRAVVLVYVIGYVFILREGYTEVEKSVGHAISEINGTAWSTNAGLSPATRPWDAVDAVQPALENGAAFVATKVYLTPRQTIGDGPNPNRRCASNADCSGASPLNYGVCTGEQMCQEKAWVPFFSASDAVSTTAYELEEADQFGIWLKSSIQFASLDASRVFTTMGEQSRTPYNPDAANSQAVSTTSSSTTLGDRSYKPPNYYTIGELLSLAQTSYESVKDEGCTLSVSFLWNCFVDAATECHPQIQVSRMDLNERRRGFTYSYANFYRPTAQGVTTRDLYTVKGVRLLISSRGEGKKVSISAIMLQISSMIALLWLANAAADFMMLHVLPERKHYRTYKQERTPDFSDLRNKIAEVEGEKKKLRDRKNRFAAKLDES